MARDIEGSQSHSFICHPHALSTSGVSHAWLYSQASELRHTFAVTHSGPSCWR